MRVESPATPMFTGYALFDSTNRLVDANAGIFGGKHLRHDTARMDGDQVTAEIIAQFKSFDGRPIEASMDFARAAAARWRQSGGGPVEAETLDGSWRLLSSHPRVEGGIALVSIDITEMKRAQLAHLENAEIFRCITDSHPLPVWVVDQESRQILYESLDASKLLGRKWRPLQPQYLTDHYVCPEAFEEIRALAGENDIIRDHEIELRRTDGSTVWCSANFRSALYRSRPALVIGVLDITERKGREDLLGFLIKHHPLPVWMNEVGSGEIIYLSGAAERLLGWRVNTGDKAPRLADRFVDKQQYLAISRELMRNRAVENWEAQLKSANGQEIWVTGNLNLVEFRGRQVVLGGIADVTKQKQRDEEVTSAREMLANAIESLSEGFALYDEDHRLVMCNSHYRNMHKAVEDIFKPGVEWTELLAEGARRGAYPEAIGREAEWLEERVQSRVHFVRHYEFSVGEDKWHSVSVHPTELGGFVVTRADISERKKAEAIERDATALLQKVLDACPSPTHMSTLDGETLYRNPASRELYGERPQITDYYLNPRDSQTLIRMLIDAGRVDDFRVQQYAADGRIFWASISARLIDFQGRRVIVSNTTDVNDVILAQEQTRQANERLTDAIESLSEGFALYDKDDRLVLANRQYRKMHAISADVLVPGVNWFDFLRVTAERNQFPVRKDRIDDWLADRARDRREFRQQEFQHSDGGWFFVSNCPTRDGGFVVTRVDITERKRAELAAEEAGELVRRVLEACPVNIQMTRAADGKLLYRSPAAAELHGDVTSALDYYVNPDDRKGYVEQLLTEGSVDDFETQLWRKNGETCWCSISSRLIDFHGEKVIVSHTYDLTDRLEMQRELERQRETLHQNEKLSALGGLLAGVAHELNNPLSVVLGLSLMLKETASDAKTAERATKISKAAERCARIVKTFLAMARQQPTQTSNVDIDDVIASAIEVAGYSIQSSDIELSVQIEPGLPPIWADPDQLSQVLINLLVNAEQALHDWDGPRKIAVQAMRIPTGGNVVVKIADSGPGISKEIQSRIFDPFFTTKEVGTGTGIGLAFCHRIVQSHGGAIEVESQEGKGSTFVISLPASNRLDQTHEAVTPEFFKSPGLSCLVVDDEKEVGAVIAEVLTRDGFSVAIANSGEQALAQLKNLEFGLILCDLKMPNMDGRRLFNYIAELHPAAIDKLAFLTGDTVSPDAQAFLRATARPYIEKPIKPYELRSFVSRLINKDV
ncbi:PAS domain S-box protein [Pseudaminobacter arsenicus]|uniref:histidine kinase n=1 Tax=Borborobacter arsenicus TaxID=1851146 RepID=A0A432UZI2_9HYPH|nr:PAS-domain containing protein [Pseudaminobacter arsenicus]RUM95305.1 PAS domain S-box protein [Pseudaminobacter arsenicus]